MRISIDDKQVLAFFSRAREKGVKWQGYVDDLLKQLAVRIRGEIGEVGFEVGLVLNKRGLNLVLQLL